ncbi:DNA polymerase III subunit alpha [Nicoliella spurrieriana]|uniref:DNA polymerase III subunit alpha n=1 Tax=Nicoliella spurrieriana TaxID=2925830 RepID=A0A976X5C9_9LACO|nr:DNA polymerase III subunit alpha [Nicoliella spurrieriana]UQS86551.1 DNA polymerase III subunit alpha [Nicoliella spurrieriana]
MGFVPLQVISSYSLLQSTISINELVTKAQARGYQSLALTDQDVMYGAVEFYNACRNAGIKAIIGMTVSIAGILDPETEFPVILLAKDQIGYQNLMRIATIKQTGDSHQISFEQIKAWMNHLFVILPLNGELNSLVDQQSTSCDEYIQVLQTWVAPDDLHLGISSSLEPTMLARYQELSSRYHSALVAVDPVEYINAEDYFANQVLKSIENSDQMNVSVTNRNQVGRNWLRPVSTVEREYARNHLQMALERNVYIAEQCNVKIEKKPTQLPAFKTPDGQTSKQYLKLLCQQGLKSRLIRNHIAANQAHQYQARLDHELDVIARMGFADYFLIVWDVINYAHSINITTGPGRGSAAGSLVAYVLSITDVDPIEYDLLFERFLNEERAQMPDIDLDIPDDRRDEVLRYVHDKYGHDRVAQIITFDTLGAKQALRDINRSFGVSNERADQWSKAIPAGIHVSLRDAYERSLALQRLVNTDSLTQLVYQTALKLEGLPRHFSTHAAGIILSNQPLVNMTPLQNGKDELLMTQYSKNYAEEVGLLKIDFLGLRNLSLLAAIIELVHHSGNPDFDIHQININDQATLQLFQRGDTNGIFQFESSGIKNVLRQVFPDNFSEVAVVDALYRPGPMQNIGVFIKRKHGQSPVDFPDQALAPILAPTYGIIVYQEQVMQVASVMGGFTLGQSDVLRRAMSKKKQSVMDSMRIKFIAGAEQRGFSKAVANTTFDYIDRFASYGFNKSHAVAYSKMAFQLAYLKTHYPLQFFTAVFNSELGNKPKVRTFLLEAKRRQLQITPPSVNVSFRYFTLQNNGIVFGLAAIRGVRSDLITELLTTRKSVGVFKGFEDLIQRMDAKFRKPEIIEPLIYSGALDCFGFHRSELIASLPEFLESINLSGGSIELLRSLQPKLKFQDEFPTSVILENEQKYLGVYLSSYPTEQFSDVINAFHAKSVSELPQLVNQQVNMVVYTNRVKSIRTKKGDQMAFVDGSDSIGDVDIVVFPRVYQQCQALLKPQRVLMITGKVENRDGDKFQLIANQVQAAANVQNKLKARGKAAGICFIQITAENNQPDRLKRLNQIIMANPGPYRVLLYWAQRKQKQLLNQQSSISQSTEVQTELFKLLGRKNVVYQKR